MNELKPGQEVTSQHQCIACIALSEARAEAWMASHALRKRKTKAFSRSSKIPAVFRRKFTGNPWKLRYLGSWIHIIRGCRLSLWVLVIERGQIDRDSKEYHILMHCSTAQHTATGSRTSAKPEYWKSWWEDTLCYQHCFFSHQVHNRDTEVPHWSRTARGSKLAAHLHRATSPRFIRFGCLKIEGEKNRVDGWSSLFHIIPISLAINCQHLRSESNCGTFRHFMEVEHSMY